MLVRRVLKAIGIGVAVLVGIALVGFAALALWPLDSASLSGSRPTPETALTHEAALAAFEAVEAREAGLPLHPRCHSVLLTHGSRVAEAVILLHGFTNCPAQYDELAPQLFAFGYNVYVPLLPRHGEADRMTMALAGLTAEEILATTNDAVDLARGLGERVSMVGLSGGGTMTAWAGQYRTDVDTAIAIARFLGPDLLPWWANRAATNLLRVLPNFMMSWDENAPKGTPEMDYAYPRWASHALAQFMLLGEVVGESASRTPPLAPGLGMLLNESDTAVSNELAERLVASWRAHGRQVDEEVLPLSLGIGHDVIDPRQPDANTGAVYPVIIEMLKRGAEGQ